MARRRDDDDDDVIGGEGLGGSGNENGVAADELRQFVERIERLEEEKAAIAGDIKDVYGEAKGRGFDAKTIRKIVSLRKKAPEERQEEEALLELYMQALGM